MNIKNVDKAINIMQRVLEKKGRVNMAIWQSSSDPKYNPIHTEDELLAECNSAACVAGWIGVSPEFIKDGGSVGHHGIPIFKGRFGRAYGAGAISEWLDIQYDQSAALCFISGFCTESIEEYAGKEKRDVTVEDVISVLKRLKSTGSVYS